MRGERFAPDWQRPIRARREVAQRIAVALLAAALVITGVGPAAASDSGRERHGGHHQSARFAAKSAISGERKRGKSITKTVTNTGAIAIPAASQGGFGPADPYPATIRVGGFKRAKVTDVNLTLHGFSHSFPSDVALLLVAPGGRNAVVMANAGGNAGVSDLELTLDDESLGQLGNADLTSGTFRPIDDAFIFTNFTSPAPAASGKTALATFDGVNPNGEWQLFVFDDSTGDDGSIATGWSLQITARSKPRNHKR